jgi:hypothetical protein
MEAGMRAVRLGILMSSIWLAACHSAPSQPVPVSGSVEAIAALAGEWDGSYESADGDRSGSIDFHLQAGSDTAFGDVIMIPRGWDRPLTAEDRPGAQVREPVPARLLSIRFVHIGEGRVSGELDRYRDPRCGCLMRTVFEGKLVKQTLEGTYLSYHQDGEPPMRGRWRAVRTKPAGP